jgi:hypothetical protein
MPRRSILSATERAALLVFPTTDDKLICHYTFTESDLAAIRQRRGHVCPHVWHPAIAVICSSGISEG